MLSSYLMLTQEEEKRYENVEARDPQVADYTDNVSLQAFSFSFSSSFLSGGLWAFPLRLYSNLKLGMLVNMLKKLWEHAFPFLLFLIMF